LSTAEEKILAALVSGVHDAGKNLTSPEQSSHVYVGAAG
jgi:hypothetical protein